MKNDVRLKKTESEKIAQSIYGAEPEYINMNETNVNKVFENKQKEEFNNSVNEYINKLNTHQDFLAQYTESFKDSFNTVEIKPLFSRILVKPFDHNPFQRIQVENGIVTDFGGLTPEHFNTDTGEMEDDQQDIMTGVVIDTGSECKYLKEGDVVFYRYGAAIPVPFFKQGLKCIPENQIIAVVNEGLNKRFSNGE